MGFSLHSSILLALSALFIPVTYASPQTSKFSTSGVDLGEAPPARVEEVATYYSVRYPYPSWTSRWLYLIRVEEARY